MPKVELHRHLEGAVRLETVREEGIRHRVFPESITLAELRPKIQTTTQFKDLASLLAMFDNTQAVFKDMDTLSRIAREAVLDGAREGIRVLELRYAPSFCSMNHGHDFSEVLSHIQAGVQRGITEVRQAGEDIAVGLICIGVGAMGEEEMRSSVDFALSSAGRDAFVGFDMAGCEDPRQFQEYAPLFQRVKDAGLKITCHASEDAELGLPQNALDAMELLHADRIGHGIQIFKSPAAVEAVRQRGIMLEVSVSSNFLTSAVKSIEEHPVRQLYDQGVRVCVNTDDPGIMNLSLPLEYALWHDVLGFTQEELASLTKDALSETFISEEALRPICERYFQ